MLYVTTRITQDAFTAHRALTENRGPEGGFFVPMKFPHFDERQISKLSEKTFSQNVTDILNLFFGTNVEALDLELAIGRYPVKIVGLNGKIAVSKAWHNPVYRFERLACGIEKVIRQSEQINTAPSDWLMLAARISVLFGTFGLYLKSNSFIRNQKVDIAVPCGNFSLLMAAWYARNMGLPIGTIVCCCNENNGIWNLIHKGELRTDTVAVCTGVPECDYTVPTDLERLIFAVLGQQETARFCEICRTGGVYCLEQDQLEQLREGIYVCVESEKRTVSTIPNLYRTTGFIADPYTALAYSGLIDYRAATGASRQALIVSEESPIFSLQFVAQCMNLAPAELKKLLE